MTLQACVAEQRRETREPAEGEIWFTLEAFQFRGRLVDSSKSGFRASHSHTSLSTGQWVRFHHSLGEGHALVMWNQILGRHIESGFLILRTPDLVGSFRRWRGKRNGAELSS
jgi:hypothetical protein